MNKVDLEGYQFFASPSDRAFLSEVLDRLAAVEEENRQLRQVVEALRRDHDDHRETVGREIASDRRRITALETPALALSQKTAGDHLDKLFSEMRRLSIRQTTTKDAARLLGVSKPLVKKLKPYLAKDSRFVILRDPRHKQRHLIRLAGT
jgi:hypothetical protein